VVNNTVVDLAPGRPGPPWIRITAHKDGTPSTHCVLRNNLSTAFSVDPDPTTMSDHNMTITDPDAFFIDFPARDVRLKTGSAAVDAGSADLAPPTDRAGRPRPQGEGVDLGAYEYSTDEDRDGMDDAWEEHHFGGTGLSDGGDGHDYDGDGFIDLHEFLAGTNPTNRRSLLAVVGMTIIDEGRLEVRWQSVSNKSYTVRQSSPDSGTWSTRAEGLAATPPVSTYTDSISGLERAWYGVTLDLESP
jgi:hypothetical protein